jgi:hypothetical protein
VRFPQRWHLVIETAVKQTVSVLLAMAVAGCLGARESEAQGAKSVSAPASAPASAPTSATAKPNEDSIAVAITGIDHLADHVSIQDFSVNGHSGAQAGKGGSEVCCVTVPRVWRKGLVVEVRWQVLNWRDRKVDYRRAVAEVEPYDELGRLLVHFLPDNSVRAVVTTEGPGSPSYIGPRIPIPRKFPWDQYDLPGGTKLECTDHTVSPAAPCRE